MSQHTRPTTLLLLALVLAIPGTIAVAQPLQPAYQTSALQEPVEHVVAIDNYRAAIEALEFRHGAYDIGLYEPLQGLGGQLLAGGDLVGARAVYNRALQISRINEGLYNANQVNLVEKLIDIDRELEDWVSVDRQYGYLENLYGRIYSDDDPQLERALRQLVVWHVDAANINLNGQRTEHLRSLYRLYKTRLRVVVNTLGKDDPFAEFLQRRVSTSEYQLYTSTNVPNERRRQSFYSLRERYMLSLD